MDSTGVVESRKERGGGRHAHDTEPKIHLPPSDPSGENKQFPAAKSWLGTVFRRENKSFALAANTDQNSVSIEM